MDEIKIKIIIVKLTQREHLLYARPHASHMTCINWFNHSKTQLGSIIITHPKRKKLRHRRVKWLKQGHTTNTWCLRDMNLCILVPESMLLTTMIHYFLLFFNVQIINGCVHIQVKLEKATKKKKTMILRRYKHQWAFKFTGHSVKIVPFWQLQVKKK